MSVYKVVEIIGTSSESWEDAGLTAVNQGSRVHPSAPRRGGRRTGLGSQ
jgi:hypothetical protein